ncbi:thiosulfate dehydrogenase [quinone] large subunit [Anaerolineae bacterium]|nr:thiosulfate dehydrogenase [quinone] large subunit [Anaerolineae bacterium]
MGHPWVGLLLRVYVGGIFIYASMYKINFPSEFAETIASYQLLPFWAVNLTALVMPWVELVSGVLMVLGIRTKSAAAVVGGMLVLFSVVILVTLLRGIPIGCGCFTSVEDPLGWGTLGRDLLWLAMTLQVYLFPSALQLEGRVFKSLPEVEG